MQNASFEDDTTLTILWRTIRLIQVIQDQVLYNKTLRADWKQRETRVLTLLRDIVASEPSMCSLIRTCLYLIVVLESAPASTPRAVCREAALSIMQNLPPSLVDHTTLSKASMFTRSNTLHADHSTGYRRCLISCLIHLQACNRWLMSFYERRHTNVLSTW
jgi:hypothetical protein